ncbi:hypothetical protein M0R45_033358 [Rubus argutus]|uniref:Uncharacterized protein n=1 Tax=Rubus argutus TaxID=59490 RepID=A0AAW1WKX5_RUBAR
MQPKETAQTPLLQAYKHQEEAALHGLKGEMRNSVLIRGFRWLEKPVQCIGYNFRQDLESNDTCEETRSHIRHVARRSMFEREAEPAPSR